MLAVQFKSLVTWMLIGAVALSILLGKLIDGIAIVAIVVLNEQVLDHPEGMIGAAPHRSREVGAGSDPDAARSRSCRA